MTKKTRLTQGIATNEKFGLTGIVRAYLYRDIRVNVLMYAREICVKATFYVLLQQPRQVLLTAITDHSVPVTCRSCFLSTC